ncbi:PKD domain-containing protein [Streptacidiphilus cavernicola]|uniref:PKD domain-containing protein n=1 Tax=Streptacidiphilus cavernicola TaxID=3342716 RepID=A0ABV6W547_9ACTN
MTISIALGSLAAPPAGADTAGGSSTLYVNKTGTCSDSNPSAGSQALPFCGIQAAADVVAPGQTIMVGSADDDGSTYAGFTLTRSGTQNAPITITTAGTQYVRGTVTLTGVQHVQLTALHVDATGNGITVNHSSDVTVDRVTLHNASDVLGANGVDINGTSSQVTVSRSNISGTWAGNTIRVQPGAQHIVITTNYLTSDIGLPLPLVQVSAATDVDVTSNSLSVIGAADIAFDSGSSGTAENNVGAVGGTPALTVSTDSAAGVTADYNAFEQRLSTGGLYQWGGVGYGSLAAFTAATGQGADDIDGPGEDYPLVYEGSPLVDSANADAPGELSTDGVGRSRVDDPNSPNTGAGAHAYFDRGAYEVVDQIKDFTSGVLATWSGAAPFTYAQEFRAFPADVATSWGEPLHATVDFGDGSAPQAVTPGATAPHVYTTPGTYDAVTTVADADGNQLSNTVPIRVLPPTAPQPVLTATTIGHGAPSSTLTSGEVSFTVTGQPAGGFPTLTMNYGDGTTGTLDPSAPTHLYPHPGTYTATVTATDVLHRTGTGQVTVTVGDAFVPLAGGPQRAFDSRTRGHDSIPAHTVVRLSRAQLHAPAGTDAAQLNLTVTDTKGTGYLTAYPDGGTRPTASNLNFTTGKTVANQATVEIGADGYVDVYNGSTKPVDVIVDTAGTQSGSSPNGLTYNPVGPVRILDTRTTGHPVASGAAVTFAAAGTHTVPANAAGVLLNVTAVNTHTTGYLTAYGAGQTQPAVSNANWAPGQTVPALVTVPLTNGSVVLRNSKSGGSVDFVADLVGYYDKTDNGTVFMPSAPVRILDTRNGTGQLGAGKTIRLHIGAAAAAALNLTATGGTHPGYLTAYPDGGTKPTASNVNYSNGQTVANMTVTPVGTDGYIDIYNGGTAPVSIIADLSGIYRDHN